MPHAYILIDLLDCSGARLAWPQLALHGHALDAVQVVVNDCVDRGNPA